MSDLLAASVIAASLAMTYFLCVRPMRQDHCANQGSRHMADTELDVALHQARTELERVRSKAYDNVSDQSSRPLAPNGPSADGPARLPKPLTTPSGT